jgi:gliding motility-associated-like protein
LSNTFPITEEIVGNYSATFSALGCISPASSVYAWIDYDQILENYNFPNVISPNGDGINDELDISMLAQTCEPFQLIILNRWGHLLYEGDQASKSFNGTDLSGTALTEGVYFYKLTFEGGEKTGFIHVVR